MIKTSMKVIIAAALIVSGMCSCSTTNELEKNFPEIADVIHSGCKGEWAAGVPTRSADDEPEATMLTFALSDNTLAFDINDIMLNCGFRDIDVGMEHEGRDLTFIISQTTYPMDCYCRADVGAKIYNFKEGAYNVCVKVLVPYISPFSEMEIDFEFTTQTVFKQEVMITAGKPTVIEITPPIEY